MDAESASGMSALGINSISPVREHASIGNPSCHHAIFWAGRPVGACQSWSPALLVAKELGAAAREQAGTGKEQLLTRLGEQAGICADLGQPKYLWRILGKSASNKIYDITRAMVVCANFEQHADVLGFHFFCRVCKTAEEVLREPRGGPEDLGRRRVPEVRDTERK